MKKFNLFIYGIVFLVVLMILCNGCNKLVNFWKIIVVEVKMLFLDFVKIVILVNGMLIFIKDGYVIGFL